jgi:hypothetical protein
MLNGSLEAKDAVARPHEIAVETTFSQERRRHMVSGNFLALFSESDLESLHGDPDFESILNEMTQRLGRNIEPILEQHHGSVSGV